LLSLLLFFFLSLSPLSHTLFLTPCLFLVGLQILDLAFNRLVELPPSFRGLASLRHLDLSHNAVAELDPDALAGLSQLQFLELHHNRLVGRAPRRLGDMGRLNRLDLRCWAGASGTVVVVVVVGKDACRP
jgi:hypothetical protein